MELSDWLALGGAAVGLLLPSLAFAASQGRLLARLDAQDRLLGRLETKLDQLQGTDLGDLEVKLTSLGEKLHALRNNFQLLVDRVDQLAERQ